MSKIQASPAFTELRVWWERKAAVSQWKLFYAALSAVKESTLGKGLESLGVRAPQAPQGLPLWGAVF